MISFLDVYVTAFVPITLLTASETALRILPPRITAKLNANEHAKSVTNTKRKSPSANCFAHLAHPSNSILLSSDLPRLCSRTPASRHQPGPFSGQLTRHDVIRQPLPVLLPVREALLTRREILRRLPGQPAVVFGDGGPFLERLDVRYQRHDGSRIWSMIPRFCSSEMPAE